MKTIAVLTSGGDAPGMNAAIRAVVRTGCDNGARVLGIRRGYVGLMEGDMFEMNPMTVTDIIQKGGTMLCSARSSRFHSEEGMQDAIDVCRKNGVDGIVVIGGDGSFRGARDLSIRGVNCVGVPGTIDNDIACCDFTIGYDTCLDTIKEMIDRIKDTSESHNRCTVVELMGRKAGFLTLNAGIAVGATAILVPEVEFDLKKDVIDRIQKALNTGKHNFIVTVAEGCNDKLKELGIDGVAGLAKYINEQLGVEGRSSILGHVQRGGSPTVNDRVNASRMGNHAAHLLLDGIGNRVVAMRKGEVLDFDIVEALEMKKTLDRHLYDVAMEVAL